ncbi:hypothetical protein GDO78_000344 [Eleutherodactylus coqui]|uniref:Uncharacterized protein n=1 Tax=Eleutherodactylus coqui TaxID=57060 RepID=A0A8J6KFA4_ELECQ|nr:hypothetical protein GDO78_000344 [Eleutherodactylus coqui]
MNRCTHLRAPWDACRRSVASGQQGNGEEAFTHQFAPSLAGTGNRSACCTANIRMNAACNQDECKKYQETKSSQWHKMSLLHGLKSASDAPIPSFAARYTGIVHTGIEWRSTPMSGYTLQVYEASTVQRDLMTLPSTKRNAHYLPKTTYRLKHP